MAICQSCVCHATVERQEVLGVLGYRIKCYRCGKQTGVYSSLRQADDIWYHQQRK